MRACHSRSRIAAFTLVELLTVIAIIGILVALLLPAVQAARESARRTQCQNRLRQVATALLHHESAQRKLPPGGTFTGGRSAGAYGHSWWVDVFPYVEQKPLYQQFDLRGKTTSVGNAGFAGGDDANHHNGQLLSDLELDLMFCPSSDTTQFVEILPPGLSTGYRIALPQYVGITGSATHESAITVSTYDAGEGTISLGGVLSTGRGRRLSNVTDGLSNTMVVGEQSDWCQTAEGQPVLCDSSCQHGFVMGPRWNGFRRSFNLTTVAHPINEKSFQAKGVAGNCGPNRTIQSPHPGGAHVALLDGSVHFLNATTDLVTLHALADRDDGRYFDLAN